MNSSTFTFGARIEGGRKALKKFRQMVGSRRRPKQVPPKKRVKWRLVSKWFNRYEKRSMIGYTIMIDSAFGEDKILSMIIDVKIKKAGGHRRKFIIKSRPRTIIQKPKPIVTCK